MYIVQYHPNDIIFDSGIGDIGITKLVNNLQQLVIGSNNIYLYLPFYLPETVQSTLIFKFFVTSSAAFKIAIDQYTNLSENFSIDYYNQYSFINEQNTPSIVSNSYNTNISTLVYEYNGFGHKIPGDRCIFRIRSAMSSTVNLAGILIKAK